MICLMQPRRLLAFFGTSALLAHVYFAAARTRRAFSAELFSSCSAPTVCTGAWGYSSGTRLCVSLLNFMRFLLVRFCSLLQSLWGSLRSLMKMRNSIGPTVSPWDTPVVTGFQVYFMQLITTLWEWHSSSSATFQLTMLSTCTSSACQWAYYGRLYQRLVKVKINNINYSPHVYRACIFNLIFIAECSQICQAWYPLHKSVLSVPSHFIFGNVLQVHLICHLPRDWVEADFLKVLRNLSPSPWPFKNNWKWPHNYIGQLPQLLWIHPLRSHLFKYSQTWCFSMEGESLLLQIFPLVLEAWDPWILRVAKTRVKKTFTTLDFFVFSVIRSPASFSSGPPFSRLPFAAAMSVEALLVDFCLLQIQIQRSFGFLTTFLCVEVLFLYLYEATCPFHLLYAFFLCLNLVKNSLFTYANLLPLLFHFLLIWMDHSWAWRR